MKHGGIREAACGADLALRIPTGPVLSMELLTRWANGNAHFADMASPAGLIPPFQQTPTLSGGPIHVGTDSTVIVMDCGT